MGENYIKSGFNRRALKSYFEENVKAGNDIYNIQIYRNNELLLRFAPSPYDCGIKSEIYSFSKSFASTAVGIAVDSGLITVEDRVVDFFGDKLPSEVSENLSCMRVKHLLSMNTGHDSCVMSHMYGSDDGVKAFLAEPVQNLPGSKFAYNTGASYMLSAIITKVTGLSLLDYLIIKLFKPLGIVNAYWPKRGGEVSMGGAELCISSDDMVKLGLLYLNNGVWQGRQIISKEWIASATSIVSDTTSNGTPDWQSGYGYQFWMNSEGGYRGDGAFGQLCMVFPEDNTVVAVRAETTDMQCEIDMLLKLLRDCDSVDEEIATDDCIFSYETLPVNAKDFAGLDRVYRLEDNAAGITLIRFYRSEDNTLSFIFSDGTREQSIEAGSGNWQYSQIESAAIKPKLMDIMESSLFERVEMVSCYTVKGERLVIQCRLLNAPHRIKISFSTSQDGSEIEVSFTSRFNLITPKLSLIKGQSV